MTRPYDCDTRLSNHVYASAHIKDERRIVDLSQLRGIRRIIQADNGNPRCSRAPQLIVRQLHRTPSRERLGGSRMDPGGLQFGERCLEDILHSAHVFDQAAASFGA